MKVKGIVASLIICFLASSAIAAKDEITLFDSKGSPVAYIADDLTIYLWDGPPVAYLSKSGDDVHIYGFNGKHLGWLKEGIVIDHDGNRVGFLKDAVNMVTSIEPIKGIKNIKPIKSIKEIAPLKPLASEKWSRTPLKLFFALGAED